MFGAQQIRKGFSLLALVLGVVFVSVPNYASAESPAINRFVRSYRMAWSAPTPIPLLNLAVHPGVFTELAALDRWDFLDFSNVNVEILRHGRTSGSEITVELLRSQRDHFVQGTYTVGEVRERLVLTSWRGELRIKRYLGAISAVRRSSMPRTWSNARHSERLLMRASEALAIHDPEVCLDNVYGLFRKEGRSAKLSMKLPEPFADRKTALSNAYFVRAACTRIALQDTESSAGDEHIALVKKRGTVSQIIDDLNRAVEVDPSHHLARLLRARIVLDHLSEKSGTEQVAALKGARTDLEYLSARVPDLEDTRALHLWAELLHAFSCGEDEGACTDLPTELLSSSQYIPSEALDMLKKTGILERKNPNVNAWALELALLMGDQKAARAFLATQEILCPGCPSTLYLKARWAEQDGRTVEALEQYALVLAKQAQYRDAAWRYAELAMMVQGPQWEVAANHLRRVSQEFSERDGVALRLLLSVANAPNQDWQLLLRVAKKRFGDKPLPSAVRKAMVRALRSR